MQEFELTIEILKKKHIACPSVSMQESNKEKLRGVATVGDVTVSSSASKPGNRRPLDLYRYIRSRSSHLRACRF